MPTASHGERLAAQFLLGVWNPSTDWSKVARANGLRGGKASYGRFDLIEAVGVWDTAHLEAAMAWVKRPFWP
jgi:hypothetical protein